jgi:hypothetical protein
MPKSASFNRPLPLDQRTQEFPTQHVVCLLAFQHRQGGAVNKLHRDEGRLAFKLVEVMDADDMGMRELMAAGGLVPQIFERADIATDFGRQKFQRDRLVEAHVLREPDFAHAAPAQRPMQQEPATAHPLATLQWG